MIIDELLWNCCVHYLLGRTVFTVMNDPTFIIRLYRVCVVGKE